MSCAESVHNEDKNFKRSTQYVSGYGERVYSGHVTGKNQYMTPSSFNNNDPNTKSKTLLKQVRCTNSAMP